MIVKDFAIEPMMALVWTLIKTHNDPNMKKVGDAFESPLVNVYGELFQFREEGGTEKEIDCSAIDEALEGLCGQLDVYKLMEMCEYLDEDDRNCILAHYVFVNSADGKPLW